MLFQYFDQNLTTSLSLYFAWIIREHEILIFWCRAGIICGVFLGAEVAFAVGMLL